MTAILRPALGAAVAGVLGGWASVALFYRAARPPAADELPGRGCASLPPAEPAGGDAPRFLEHLRHVNRLRYRPEWYNALTQNCTTAIRGHGRPFPELRARSHINEVARATGDAPDFSRRIRQPTLDARSSHPLPGRTT